MDGLIDLDHGAVAYRLSAPGDGPLAVMIHGYSTPATVWRPLEARLNAAGVATLSIDLYGHGRSAKPALRYTRALFGRQLAGAIDALAAGRRLHLVGWSMGAMVAAAHATTDVGRVASLFLIAPSGLPIRMGLLGRIALLPGLGDVGHMLIGDRALRAAQSAFFANPVALAAYLGDYDRQAAEPGFRQAMLSTLRHMRMDDFRDGYAALGRSGLPVRVLWPTADRATPHANAPLFRQLVPQADIRSVDGVGHAAHLDDPDLVAGHAVEWLADRS
jgi:pimeloyl-ACP methyl ester carboxylesterase